MLSLDERKKYKKSMIRLSSLKDVDYSNLSKFDTPICTAVEVPICIDFMRVLESLDIAFISWSLSVGSIQGSNTSLPSASIFYITIFLHAYFLCIYTSMGSLGALFLFILKTDKVAL